jgi:hypothetical protein
MIEILYDPEDAGKVVFNKKGRLVKRRKYHSTVEEMTEFRNKWLEDIKDLPEEVRGSGGKLFFNPYRKGIYYYQIQALFLLGVNKYHSLDKILSTMYDYMSKKKILLNNKMTTAWNKFKGKKGRTEALKCKDYCGRVEQNMLFFQRLTGLHPCGYKLKQVGASVDFKRVSKKGFKGTYSFYRLSTYDSSDKALPIRDFREYDFPKHESKYISSKFVGKTITKDKIVIGGEVQNAM